MRDPCLFVASPMSSFSKHVGVARRIPFSDVRSCLTLFGFWSFGESCCIIWKHVGDARTSCQSRRIRFSDVRSCVIGFVFSQFLCHQSKTCHTKNQKHKTVSTTPMSSEWHIFHFYTWDTSAIGGCFTCPKSSFFWQETFPSHQPKRTPSQGLIVSEKTAARFSESHMWWVSRKHDRTWHGSCRSQVHMQNCIALLLLSST